MANVTPGAYLPALAARVRNGSIDGHGQPRVRRHPLDDRVAQVDQAAVRVDQASALGVRRRGAGGGDSPLVRLDEHPSVRGPHVAHHQQPEIAHEGIGDPRVVDVVARDVQPERPARQAAAVRELDLEVELDPVLHRQPPPQPVLRGGSAPTLGGSAPRFGGTIFAPGGTAVA